MTLQAVNELIASLESAGELSIKERKYLELAKEFKQLAAENSFLMHRIEWPKQQCPTTGDVTDVEPADFIPATDCIVASIKADGVEEFIGLLQQHVDEGDFVGDEVAVIVGAIDCGKEFFEQLRDGADK
ncbi:TPA: hypothetical protein U0U98_000076 [Klebsiella pneumoniae]|nr:hypothetical protein [Klebsiella pneumoniae]HEL9747244.1 hypothetical protein [Klebsiella pneumoniae]HEL9843459.1 hypothetical protein [Klebsiella pneumoniae]HEL9936540.1 hypothetical protein [Klebsiella pneumoniae]HEL9941984.1 hypothetical protein [Klebsiella pneumoniae]